MKMIKMGAAIVLALMTTSAFAQGANDVAPTPSGEYVLNLFQFMGPGPTGGAVFELQLQTKVPSIEECLTQANKINIDSEEQFALCHEKITYPKAGA